MKRVGNRSAQLVRSASRRRKATLRFQFDFTIKQVYGTKAGLSYLVKWSRGIKEASTSTIQSTKNTASKSPLPFNEKLSLLVTLYKDDNKPFDSKDAKLALFATNHKNQTRTAAKLHFDLAHFAGVPTATAEKVFKLSSTVSISATVHSRFLNAASKSPGSAGASSALSGVSARSDDFDDDFDDLAIDEVPQPELQTATAVKSRNPLPSVKSSPQTILSSPQPSSASSLKPISRTPSLTAKSSPPSPPVQQLPSSRPKTNSPPAPSLRRARPSAVRTQDITTLKLAENDAKLQSLSKENERLSTNLKSYHSERSGLQQSHKQQIEQLNAKLHLNQNDISKLNSQRSASDTNISRLEKQNAELQENLNSLKNDMEPLKQSCEEYRARCKTLTTAEERCRQLSREVDRLTIITAQTNTSSSSTTGDDSELHHLVTSVRKEKEDLEEKIKARDVHASKVKSTYDKLAEMYSQLRKDNIELSKEAEEHKEKFQYLSTSTESSSSSKNQDIVELRAQLDDARQQILDVKSGKDSLHSDHDRLVQQIASLQKRLEKSSVELEESRRESNKLYSTIEEVKEQRDSALKKSAVSGTVPALVAKSGEVSTSRSEEELKLVKGRLEREQSRFTQKIQQLESEVSVLQEGIEYERAEKTKARDERDNMRDNSRVLERKTSQAAKQNDEFHSMRRQISTQQMRDHDHTSMIKGLQSENQRLQAEIDQAMKDRKKESLVTDDVGEVLRDLVCAKLALAQTEDEKLNLQFSLKQLKKKERLTQQKLASHASRLEVKLGQATEELVKLRKEKGNGKIADTQTRDFNELDSDIDY